MRTWSGGVLVTSFTLALALALAPTRPAPLGPSVTRNSGLSLPPTTPRRRPLAEARGGVLVLANSRTGFRSTMFPASSTMSVAVDSAVDLALGEAPPVLLGLRLAGGSSDPLAGPSADVSPATPSSSLLSPRFRLRELLLLTAASFAGLLSLSLTPPTES